MSFHRKNKLVLISCIVLMVTGIMFIGIQFSNANYLLAFYQKYISIAFNSCLCLILVGAGYMLLQFNNNKNARAFLVALSLLLIVISALTLLEYLFHFSAGIDGMLVPGSYSDPKAYPFAHGQMLPATSVVYLCLGLALTGFCSKTRFVHILSQYLLHVVSVFCSILLIGFAYSSISLADMQAHALNYLWLGGWIITLSIAASFRHSSLGLTSLFSGDLVGNKMARRLFVMMAVSILVFGLVRVRYLGFTIWQYDTAISLFVFCILVAALLIIWHTANWLNKVDLRRIKAENELKVLNGELGKRVEERTAELSDLLEKYKESELKFRTLAEKSIVGIYRVQNGRFTYVNFRFAEVFGYSPAELMNAVAVETIVHESYHSIAAGHVKARIEGTYDSVHYEAMANKKNGEKIWVEFYANTAIIGGEPTIIGSMIDITERKMAEDSIEEQNKKLREIAWLQSHIVRAPLARMMGIINLLRDHDLDITEYDEYLKYLSTSADELDAIIKDITNKTEEIK